MHPNYLSSQVVDAMAEPVDVEQAPDGRWVVNKDPLL